MTSNPERTQTRPYWFVGAAFKGGLSDQTSRFLQEGIWENGSHTKYLDDVRAIQAGDRIAIKSSYTRKRGLPFDNQGHSVSVMAIKATGIVKENLGDGRTLKVDWKPLDPPLEWYFYTHRGTVWRVMPGDWTTDALIGFAFEEKPQDINRFRNAPFWRERFGDRTDEPQRFLWTRFYEAIADKLLTFRNRRSELIARIHAIASKVDGVSNLQDRFADGSSGLWKDICPFTAIGIFNRGTTVATRKAIAKELAHLLGVTEPVPKSFEGIPILNNQNSWFFGYDKKRKPADIDTLWEVFAQAIALAESEDARPAFGAAYDQATQVHGVKWNLTIGLYWIRPWNFPSLDGQSQHYIRKKLGMTIGRNGPKGSCNATDYLALLDTLEARFQEKAFPVHSFPELSLAAWELNDSGTSVGSDDSSQDSSEDSFQEDATDEPIETYSIDDIVTDGCFLARGKLESILERLRTKKNLILQGPPGTGKTWLAKRLAYALVGQRNGLNVRAVQFHPNLSYEDFIRGWRPAGDGKLTLVDGPFMEMIEAAKKDLESRHVIIIEEINRGNPAQIFGEMLTLLEADKRTPKEALELSYRRSDDERVFIPHNLYVVGTMNIADRSLALVDLALRRRFAFIDLEPTLGQQWREWVQSECGMDAGILDEIKERILALNNEISTAAGLGPQFRVGHSYVTPQPGTPIRDAREWFRQVVETEIGPLLDEYWFDALDKSREAKKRLLEGF